MHEWARPPHRDRQHACGRRQRRDDLLHLVRLAPAPGAQGRQLADTIILRRGRARCGLIGGGLTGAGAGTLIGPEGTIIGGGYGAWEGMQAGVISGAIIGNAIEDTISQMAGRSDDPSEKSMQSRPTNCPSGTRPIDRAGLTRAEIHKIKQGLQAGAKDYVGIAPNGDVITTNPDGTAENHGGYGPFLE
jgi:hypothetical protein